MWKNEVICCKMSFSKNWTKIENPSKINFEKVTNCQRNLTSQMKKKFTTFSLKFLWNLINFSNHLDVFDGIVYIYL